MREKSPFDLSREGGILPNPLSSNILTVGLVTTLTGVLLSGSPYGWRLEEDLGLAWLFNLRGARSVPSEVVVVTTNRKSANDLEVPQEPWKWPRSLHRRLIQTLTEQGARVIAFDLFFKEAGQPEEHQLFAEAIREAGNVVLIEKMTTLNQKDPAAGIDMHMRIRPHPDFAQSAAALAPNPLPGVPFRVNQFWLFEPSGTHVATLPFIAFQLHTLDVYEHFLALLRKVEPALAQALPPDINVIRQDRGIQRVTQQLRDLFRRHASLANDLLMELEANGPEVQDRQRQVLESLITAYHNGDSQYLDFYGPPRTVTTIPYSCVLGSCGDQPGGNEAGLPTDFSGKAVFVGLSEEIEAEQSDRFHTVFTSESGLYISGVEIAATGFSNLLENRQIKPLELWLHLLIVAAWGMVIGVVFRVFPPARFRTGLIFAVMLVGAGIGFGTAYLGMAYYWFTSGGVWLPTVIPLLIQLPMGIGFNSFSRYLEVHRERQHIQHALEHYIPKPIAHQIAKNFEGIKTKGRLLEGICLETDAEHYTALAESLELQELNDLMNRYYEVVFEPVRKRDGIVTDVIGDAVLAIWTGSEMDRNLRTKACEAALHIAENVERFNQLNGRVTLPTRIGIHGGPMLLGHVGAQDHYEYRAVGDIVNTATRIEGLNKYLGTRILASGTVIEGLSGFLTRDVGTFQLKGKSQAIKICEILCTIEAAEVSQQELIKIFSKAMDAFREERWEDAKVFFQECLSLNNADGPSRYYLELCESYTTGLSRPDSAGVIVMAKK